MSRGATANRFPIVDAVLQSDRQRLEEIVRATPADDPHRELYAAILESGRAQEGGGDALRASLKTLSGFLEKPPADLELFQVLLLRVVTLGCRSGNIGEAARALKLLEQLAADTEPRPDMMAAVLYSRAVVLLVRGEAQAARRAIERALETLGPGSDRQRCVYKSLHIETAMHMGDWRTAERESAEIEKAPFDRVISIPWAYVRVRVLSSAGRNAEALAALDAAPTPTTAFEQRWVLVQRLFLLLKLLRIEEARALLEGPGASLPLFDRATLGLYSAVLRSDLAGAREHARRILTDAGITPGMVLHATGDMAVLELAARRPHTARLLLQTIDPEEVKSGCEAEWARLHFLEGNEARAVEHFRRFLERKPPDRFPEELLTAHEMTVAQLGRLWTLAQQSAPPAAAPPGPMPAAAPAPPPAKGRKPARSEDGTVLVGDSPDMLRIKADVERFAPLDETVLITGETGTGKELVARLLHDRSPRAKRAYLAVNCAAISDTLLETELFGHVRGAFTGAERAHDGLLVAAGDGTIFFDEIGSMSPRVQASLLRVLEERKVRPVGGTKPVAVTCRVIAATNQPLDELVKAGGFRQDLYYRLARLEVRLPPLRARSGDIPLLARHFLQDYFEYGEVALGDDLLEALAKHSWPGNVRELRNEIERIAILAGDNRVLGAELFRRAEPAGKTTPAPAKAAAAEPRAEAGAAGAPTRDRKARLHQLFLEKRELSRGEVARLLDCAPGTAAKTLEALAAERLIEKVEPTPAPRTHYFRLRSS